MAEFFSFMLKRKNIFSKDFSRLFADLWDTKTHKYPIKCRFARFFNGFKEIIYGFFFVSFKLKKLLSIF
jgi:hypothetical protein